MGVKEEDVQRAIIEFLELNGFQVMQSSRRGVRGKCPRCQQQVKVFGGDGATKGLPDLFVRHSRSMNRAHWIGLEVKGPKTPLSCEQKALAENGDIVVARSIEDAIREIDRVAGPYRWAAVPQ